MPCAEKRVAEIKVMAGDSELIQRTDASRGLNFWSLGGQFERASRTPAVSAAGVV